MIESINYITNLDVKVAGGGWSGMNHHIFSQLSKYYTVNVVQKVDPPTSILHKLISKSFRILHLPGIFPTFTISRLQRIRDEVRKGIDTHADLDFFHGITPWVFASGPRPYALYTDACFATYISVYHDSKRFPASQLKSLFVLEENFLKKATAVFFSSGWSMEQTKKAYGLDGNNFHIARLGGNLPMPAIGPSTSFEKYFLFVGLDFRGKGGQYVADAFRIVRNSFPDFKLYILGGKPPEKVLHQPGVTYLGYLDKRIPQDLARLIDVFSKAYCLILPTNRDMTPLVIVEAGYFGCPTIAVRKFGIPEMIVNGETGLLMDSPVEATSLANAMIALCSDKNLHLKLRHGAFDYSRNSYSWEKTGNSIKQVLDTVRDTRRVPNEQSFTGA